MRDVNYWVEFDGVNKGLCIWITGLPCSGKTTIANALKEFFEKLGKKVTVIDGDVLRDVLSDYDFSREGRRRINLIAGYIASEIVRHGGIVICALISPYREIRDKVRSFFTDNEFILIYLNTPIEICMERDTKGLYEKASSGQIENFTGIGDVYEPPADADLVIDTSMQNVDVTVEEIAKYVLTKVKRDGEEIENAKRDRKVFSVEEVVSQFYHGFFDREPDIEGFNHYVNLVKNNELTISDLIGTFLESEEFRIRNSVSGSISVEELVRELYLGILDRIPDIDGFNHYVGLMKDNEVTVFDLIRILLRSEEFRRKSFTLGLIDVEKLVDELYLSLLNRMPDFNARERIKSQLMSGSSVQDVVRKIIKSEEFFMKQYDTLHHMLPRDNHVAFVWEIPAIVFIHIPKTAGQSLHYLFRQKFGEKKVSPLFNNLYQLPVNFVYSYDVIFGHTDYDAVRLVVQRKEIKLITFLRDPIKRLISLYRFWWSHDPEFHRENMAVELANKYTIQEFFKAEEVRKILWNDMFGRFMGYKTCHAIKDEWFAMKDKAQRKKFIENEIIPLIRAQIDKYFYIGLQENFIRDTYEMFKKLGCPCSRAEIKNVRINVTDDNIGREGFKKEKPEFTITETVISAIKDLTELDRVLYSEVVKIKTRSKGKSRRIQP